VRLPGVRIRGQLLDRRRQFASREISDRDVLEHRAKVGANRDPDLSQALAEPAYSTVSGPIPRTFAIGPSTARTTSATVTSSAGRASQ